MTDPSAQARSSTKHGSSTSLSPSIQAPIASLSVSSLWARTSASVTSHPTAEDHTRALIESHSLSMETSVSAGRDSSGMARTLEAPSRSMPAKVATMMEPKGSNALTARNFVPGLGSSGPTGGDGSALSSTAASDSSAAPPASASASTSAAAFAAASSLSAPKLSSTGMAASRSMAAAAGADGVGSGGGSDAIGPTSRPVASRIGSSASSKTGKKRYGMVRIVETKGSSSSPSCLYTSAT
mmetsp:Transcript_60227/g.138171  ORF Transcript_60227/g.138171 Transcript_60227/m.138171 type:complete len:240 (-) Transcript_60227:737-1456(-)